MSEEQNHFSLRKLSIGLASVLVGVSIFGTSQTVKADTVADQNTSAVTSNAQSSDTQKNENAVKSSFSNDNQANNAKSNLIQTQVEGKKDQKQDSVPKTQEANDSSDLDAEKGIVRTSSLQKTDNQSNNHAEDNSQTQPQNEQKLDLTKNSPKFAKKVLATNLIATPPTTNGGFDEATWGKLDVNNWQGFVQDGVYQLTGYTGDSSHIIIPNEADFEQAGKSTSGLQVGITRGTAYSLSLNNAQTIAFSKTNNQKVKAIGTDWSNAFSVFTLNKFDGSNFDVSNVTNMDSMFSETSISDLTSLAHWNVSNVTNMNAMFAVNSISDLTPLTHWDTSKVTNMRSMFDGNSISNLTPLAHWDTSKVTNMGWMFGSNYDLIDLKPIANWNISSVENDNGFYNFFGYDPKLNLTNINNTPLMQGFLKEPDALNGATFITNNADLVKATINKDLPNSTTAKRTITFNIPHAKPKTIVQIINYKAITTVQVDFDNQKIVQTYPVKESDWQLDTSKQNDAIIVNGQIHFKSVKIPHINGYKARVTRNKINPAMLMVSFMAVPSENKPSLPDEEKPSKPSAPSDSQFTDLDHKVVDVLNQSDSGWTMQNAQPATYTVEVPDDTIIDLSDLVIAEPVHAQTTTQIRVTKRFKLRKHGKKHVAKHFKHRKKAVRTFKKYRL